MIDVSIVPATLRSFDYYYRKLPMYLQQSYGFSSHFRLWYDALMGENTELTFNGIVPSFETMLYLLNIFDTDAKTPEGISKYLENIIKIPNANASNEHQYGTTCYMLDNIGALFGVKRHFSVELDGGVKKELTLDNKDFLILIKATIVKNYCEGTFEQLKEFYQSVGLFVVITTSAPGICNIYMATAVEGANYDYSDDIKSMFLSGLLTIESMGIEYHKTFIDMTKLLVWYKDGTTEQLGWGPEIEGSDLKAGEWTI